MCPGRAKGCAAGAEERRRGGHTGPVPLLLAPPELARRRPVWAALSALFLDTGLEDADYRRMARTLRDSGYAPAEWHGILRTEVAPVVGGNLFSAAGEWAGFDAAWLEAAILARDPRATLRSRWAMRLIAADLRRLAQVAEDEATPIR